MEIVGRVGRIHSLAEANQSTHEMFGGSHHPLSPDNGEQMPIRVLITDDHSVVRQGLRMFLGLDPEL